MSTKYNLILNPGSTSTKISLFQGTECCFTESIRHTQDELKDFEKVADQEEFRTEVIKKILQEKGYSLDQIGGIITIGGLIRPGDAGVYRINEGMVDDLRNARYYEHASNLGVLIAWRMGHELGLEVYTADAITVDEMADIARISGLPELTRQGRSHTLNQKSTARRAAAQLGKSYEDANLVVAHLGGGISIAAHVKGRIADVSMSRGEGAFSIDRSGGLNAYALAKLCYSGKFTKDEMLQKLNGNGGVVAYLGTRDFVEVENRWAAGDEKAVAIFESLAYQIAKEIGAMAAAVGTKPDAIVLTGGMANAAPFVKLIRSRIDYIAQVIEMPGESEMEALAEYLTQVQSGELNAREYQMEG